MSAMHNLSMRAAFAAVSASLLGAVGCTVHTDPPPRQARETVYVESATPAPPPPATRYRAPPPSTEVWVHGHRADRTNRPANVNSYPRVRYGDSTAYLINGRWYYKVNDQYWVVFREEPRELLRRRVEMRNQGYVR